jgi:hypothetical protein
VASFDVLVQQRLPGVMILPGTVIAMLLNHFNSVFQTNMKKDIGGQGIIMGNIDRYEGPYWTK